MSEPSATNTTRRRLPFWLGITALILLFPAIVIPWLVSAFREPAFQSIDEIDTANVRSMELFLLNRPDGGPDIGGTRGLFVIPPSQYQRTLELLRNAEPLTTELPRGIWLGRLVITLNEGRTQTVMLHRPKQETEKSQTQRMELRIGRYVYLGPPVEAFVARMAEISGLPAKKEGE